MFSFRPTDHPARVDVYFKERKLALAFLEAGKVILDDFPAFSVAELRNMDVADFPQNFVYHWRESKRYCKYFYYFSMERKGKKLHLTVHGYLSLNEGPIPWLWWNPDKFNKEMARLAKKKGHRAKVSSIGSIDIDYSFESTGKLTMLFTKAIEHTTSIMYEAERNLLKRAAASLK